MQEHIARLCTEAGVAMLRTGGADLDNVRSCSEVGSEWIACD
jgi:hypothetical protein